MFVISLFLKPISLLSLCVKSYSSDIRHFVDLFTSIVSQTRGLLSVHVYLSIVDLPATLLAPLLNYGSATKQFTTGTFVSTLIFLAY